MRTCLVPFLLILTLAAGACGGLGKKEGPERKTEKQLAEERSERLRKACASDATYARLKDFVFDEAARIRNGDPRNLDPVAAGSVVRMEAPLVKSRDEKLDVTVCTGRFILELPPGAENAFDGLRRVTADVEYSAQAAADGSGLVYRMDGAEPIIYRLATFGLNGGPPAPRVAGMPQPSAPPSAPPQVAAAEPARPAPRPQRAPKVPAPEALPAKVTTAPLAPPAPAKRAEPAVRPSYNCRYARTTSERLVCGSPALAGRDRAMSSVYYGAIARGDPVTKQRIRASRDAFLARRERCGGSEACIAQAYEQRIREIRGMAGE